MTEQDRANRVDPYKQFKFKIKWNGIYVAAVDQVSGMSHAATVIKSRSGGEPSVIRVAPGQSEYESITLARGITCDINFQAWASKVWNYPNSTQGNSDQSDQNISLQDFRKDITIELYNEAGQKVVAYNVYRCWASEYKALPELDAEGNVVAIQSLILQNEGWERDPSFPA
jgi:phage tail-like protein